MVVTLVIIVFHYDLKYCVATMAAWAHRLKLTRGNDCTYMLLQPSPFLHAANLSIVVVSASLRVAKMS